MSDLDSFNAGDTYWHVKYRPTPPEGLRMFVLTQFHCTRGVLSHRFFAVPIHRVVYLVVPETDRETREWGVYGDDGQKLEFGKGKGSLSHLFVDPGCPAEYRFLPAALEYVDGEWIKNSVARYDYNYWYKKPIPPVKKD